MAEKEQGAAQVVSEKKAAGASPAKPANVAVGAKQKSAAKAPVAVKAESTAVATAAEPKAQEAEGAAKGAAKAQEAKKAEVKEKVREIVLERVYNVPLSEAYKTTHYKRADFALNLLRRFAARHMSAEKENVRISTSINEAIRGRGSRRPLKMVKVRLTKDKQGKVLAEAVA